MPPASELKAAAKTFAKSIETSLHRTLKSTSTSKFASSCFAPGVFKYNGVPLFAGSACEALAKCSLPATACLGVVTESAGKDFDHCKVVVISLGRILSGDQQQGEIGDADVAGWLANYHGDTLAVRLSIRFVNQKEKVLSHKGCYVNLSLANKKALEMTLTDDPKVMPGWYDEILQEANVPR